jgi:NAD(P)-dependent dehydrogenase (short-subunit alcohol dehydrogenase family)
MTESSDPLDVSGRRVRIVGGVRVNGIAPGFFVATKMGRPCRSMAD